MAVDDQAGDLIVFVGNDGLLQELLERNIGQRDPRRDHLRGTFGGHPREAVAGARRRGLGEEIAEIIEHIAGGVDGVAIDHEYSGPSALMRDGFRRLSPDAKLRSPHGGEEFGNLGLEALVFAGQQLRRRQHRDAEPVSPAPRLTSAIEDLEPIAAPLLKNPVMQNAELVL